MAADQFAQRFGQSWALFVARVLLLFLSFIVAFRVSSTDSSLFMVGMLVSVFAFIFPYSAMVASLVAAAPQTQGIGNRRCFVLCKRGRDRGWRVPAGCQR